MIVTGYGIQRHSNVITPCGARPDKEYCMAIHTTLEEKK